MQQVLKDVERKAPIIASQKRDYMRSFKEFHGANNILTIIHKCMCMHAGLWSLTSRYLPDWMRRLRKTNLCEITATHYRHGLNRFRTIVIAHNMYTCFEFI